MDKPKNYGSKRALELLLTKLGDARAVCRHLWISHAELDGYLSGARAIPLCVSLHALDLLAGDECRPSGGLA